jgi:uncharacterized membrane protein/predicted DsbA family dithiol-disulfide isomerase
MPEASTEDSSPTSSVPPSRRKALVFALLCLLGVAVSVELSRIHVFVHTDPTYHTLCAVSEAVNCETVAASPWAVSAGLPVSLWGVLGYLVMGILALWGWSKRRLHPAWPWGLLLLLSGFSVAVSAILAFISFTRIDSLCLFCMTSYAISLALLVVAVLGTRSARGQSVGLLGLDVKAVIARPRLMIPLVLAGLVAIVLLEVFVPPYWRTPGWADLPSLASGTNGQGHHWIGAEKPALTIIEFSDYECPHCRSAHKNIRLLAGKLADKVRLVHRHLPLDMACHPGIGRPFHARACLFAEAAECAGLQGRFWEMNDALFSMQERVKAKDMDPVDLAVRIGLDRGRFKRCLESHESAPRVLADLRESVERKLDGTPTFIVGEKVFLGRLSESELDGLLLGSP